MGLTSLALRLAAPLPKIENFDRYMFVGPHPDDIEIGAGATAAKLAASGKKVCFVVCMDGRYGDANMEKGYDPDELIQTRKTEAIASAMDLGVKDVRFLDFSDGGFYDEKDLLKAIAKEVGSFSPQVVFAPDPCVSSECHLDHLNTGEAVRRVAYIAAYQGIMDNYSTNAANVELLAYYMTAKPNAYVKTSGFVNKQLSAVFSNHLSQFPTGCEDAKTISLYIKLRAVDFGLRSLKGQAEGFRVLGRTHMHCLPESGK